MEALLESARRRLIERGCKWTGQRRDILRNLLENPDRHLSAEELHYLLQQQGLVTGLATVYRTLDLLAETGIVHKLQFGDGCSRYELADEDHHHHHLICSECGKVYEVDLDLLEKLERKVEDDYDFEISGHHLKFFGRCSQCKKHGEDDQT